jgi:hypothetical protein
LSEIIPRHLDHRARQRRNHRRHDNAGNALAGDPVMRTQAGDEDPELVGRPFANRGEPPAVHQLVTLKNAKDDVGVADVDR